MYPTINMGYIRALDHGNTSFTKEITLINNSFYELLLSELRMVTYQPGAPEDMTDDLLCKAVTLNMNLQSLGYTLKAPDILRMAVSPSLDGFYKSFAALVPDVKAKPMYPGFPLQVMEISEAEFRFHQLCHYLSTYGVEYFSGVEVHRGWLPEYEGPERTKKDTLLLNAKVISLIPESDAPAAVLTAIFNRRERLTNPELTLVQECIPLCSVEHLQGLNIRFKENLELLFPLLMRLPDRNIALVILRAICLHTGDVFRCAKKYLHDRRWHLTTSEKRLLVKLLESYPVENLRQNMIASRRLRERSLLVLKHLDYNRFSKSALHLEAVRALRNGELLSWHGVGEALLQDRKPEALDHFAKRPGYMLRMLNRLLSLGYSSEDIENVLLPAAGGISTHLILKTIRSLMKRRSELEEMHRRDVLSCKSKYAREESFLTFSNDSIFNRFEGKTECRRRSAILREWTTAMDKAKKEAFSKLTALQEELGLRRQELAGWKDICKRIKDMPNGRLSIRNADLKKDLHVLLLLDNPEYAQETVVRLEAECQDLENQIIQEREAAERRYAEETASIDERRDAANKVLQEWKERRIAELKKEFPSMFSRYDERMMTLPSRMEKELEQLEKQYEAKLHNAEFDFQTVEILKKLLVEHFRKAQTPLKGKKVFLDLSEFDLAHSTLETEDRSRDGGYIRSGISYKIPENAKYVRFFVYWNDRSRVDLDLHAGGLTTERQSFRVGWNSDFRKYGVIHSGDITHSDAAEYIDIDLSAPVQEVHTNINLFSGKKSFKEIATCYVGMMLVDSINQDVKLYDPANCLFTHAMTQNAACIYYGFVDVQQRYVRFIGQPNQYGWYERPLIESAETIFSMESYLDCLLEAQDVQIVDTEDEAEVVLTMGKSLDDNAISLVDHNYFLEC